MMTMRRLQSARGLYLVDLMIRQTGIITGCRGPTLPRLEIAGLKLGLCYGHGHRNVCLIQGGELVASILMIMTENCRKVDYVLRDASPLWRFRLVHQFWFTEW